MIADLLFLILFALPIVSLTLQGITYPFLAVRIKPWFLKIYFYLSISLSFAISILLFLFFEGNNVLHVNGFLDVTWSIENNVLMFFSLMLYAMVGTFSFNYLHKEIGFHKFHLNFNLFWVGILIFIWAADSIMMYVGWEFIGITSIFLISFYNYRYRPVNGSLYAMVFYKMADFFLILALITLKHAMPSVEIKNYAMIGIMISSLIKAGAFPFTSWLSRAIEGPTQSSAIYYTSLAVNAGIILMLKYSAGIANEPALQTFLLVMGALTVLYSTLVGRVQSNAKSSLVYSSSVQTGVIFIEIAMGFNNLAIFHMFSSSFFKAYQFLRAPSFIRLYHSMEGEYGKVFTAAGAHFERILPGALRRFLYKLAYHHFYLDTFIEKVGTGFESFGRIVRHFFYPVITYNEKGGYLILNWLVYFLLVIYLVDIRVFEIHRSYMKILPVFLFLTSLMLITAGTVFQFVASFVIFKLIEFLFTNTLQVDAGFGYTTFVFASVFVFLVTYLRFTTIKKGDLATEVFTKSMIIILMLSFANLPLVFMSDAYEHLLEHLYEEHDYINLILYAAANTTFNIGLFVYIFRYVYLKPKENRLC